MAPAHRDEQRDYAADDQSHNRASSHSAPKRFLFSGRHIFAPEGSMNPTESIGQCQPTPGSSDFHPLRSFVDRIDYCG